MENTALDFSLVEGNYMIDGILQINDGIIKDNPFSKSVGNSLAANWLLENKEKAKNKIRDVMREQRLGTHEVDECYDYAVYFFLEKDDRDFDPDYFGNEASETYTIEIYCLYKLKMIVYEYRNEMKKRLDKTVHLVDIDKDDADSMPKKCISFDVLSKASFEEEKDNYGFNEVIEFDDLQDIFDIELPMYDEEFRMMGMINFRLKDFVYHLFLSDRELKMDGNRISDDDAEEISSKLGITPSALHKTMELVAENNKTKREVFKDLPGIIMRLLKGKMEGWEPIY